MKTLTFTVEIPDNATTIPLVDMIAGMMKGIEGSLLRVDNVERIYDIRTAEKK